MRQPVTTGKLPHVAEAGDVAIEDERFYKHKGVDYEGVVRAAIKNLDAPARRCRAARR